MLAFHAVSTTTDPSDHGMLDGVFALDATGANLRVLVRDGIAPSPAGQPLTEFQDAVALDDEGDVAFLAGPLSDDADPSDEGSPGVLVLRGGAVSLLAYPGQVLGTGKVTGVALGPAGGGALAAPSIGPDGTVPRAAGRCRSSTPAVTAPTRARWAASTAARSPLRRSTRRAGSSSWRAS